MFLLYECVYSTVQEEERNAREQGLERERAEHRHRMEEEEHRLSMDRQRSLQEERLRVKRYIFTTNIAIAQAEHGQAEEPTGEEAQGQEVHIHNQHSYSTG